MSTDNETIDDAAAIQELTAKLSSFEWRIHNLYTVKDKAGNPVPFRPNWAQYDFLCNIHHRNVILKARQLGFTTLISIYFLDSILFNNHHSCGIIAQGLKEAGEIFDDKIKFAYDNLPPWLKAQNPLVTDNAGEIELANGSKIIVGLSLRSGTFQKLHISEYGKISAKFPEKAKEIKTGAFNTVPMNGQIFVESTAEGQSGEFFELVKASRKIQDEGREPHMGEFKFHFYPWHKNPEYILNDGDAMRVIIDDERAKYFRELEKEHGIFLTLGQKAWYTLKANEQGEDMFREYPTTPEESFQASMEGAIYARQMRLLRKSGQICRVPWEPKSLVHTFWDLGSYNYMAIWFFQQVGREWRMIRYYQSTGADLSQYVDAMREFGYSYGEHYLPHDGDTKRLQATGGNKTVREMLKGLGLNNVKVVPRTNDVRRDIETACKPAILKILFDQVHCAEGIRCLDSYRKVQNKDGVWLEEPRHDEFSDGCDAFRTFAVSWKDKIPVAPVSLAMNGSMPL